jgi:hypothetical protein
MIWKTYLRRWKGMYRKTLPPIQWIRAAFVLPFIPAYYRAVISTLISISKSAVLYELRSISRRYN